MISEVRQIVADVLGLEAHEVQDDLSMETSDTWDSLNHLRIVTALEQEFDVALTMDEIASASSVARLAAIIERHVSRV